eukprot:9074811-Prorocentrum_lima.AAC.1
MTSSLVGSEMCIRDSRRKKHDTTKRRGTTTRHNQNDADDTRSGKHTNPCLLYTSDAADDM